MKAADVMISTVISVDPDARVEEVARILQAGAYAAGAAALSGRLHLAHRRVIKVAFR